MLLNSLDGTEYLQTGLVIPMKVYLLLLLVF